MKFIFLSFFILSSSIAAADQKCYEITYEEDRKPEYPRELLCVEKLDTALHLYRFTFKWDTERHPPTAVITSYGHPRCLDCIAGDYTISTFATPVLGRNFHLTIRGKRNEEGLEEGKIRLGMPTNEFHSMTYRELAE